ncbi:PorP/SprF family type IX secretion system membrane protein [Aegicerativicinus sediminis]|uniref:PorP/SprF family type IX secretion system membrane protein n=1 Tax=Aegicerativicinus sediminis TaxID=2893202 RepID=UPI001E62E334|nr:type IX secretion system membrane protein PorP/SprF [Aegicerativicinus sediminis]
MNKIPKLLILIGLSSIFSHAQQDAQYTQYMYNTIVVNPAYAGSRETMNINGLYRAQWIGLEGAPRTMTLAGHTPLSNENIGIGVSLMRDEIWIQTQTHFNVDFSYTIKTDSLGKLAFGLKAGGNFLNIDYSKTNPENPSEADFMQNVDNRFYPNIGFGLYYYTEKFYIGYSAPSLLRTRYYANETGAESYVSQERINHYLISGYVFDINPSLKFKPAVLLKAVSGAPLQIDTSANFLFNEKLTVGVAYRWSAAMSGLVGFQLTDKLMIGYAYDWETSRLNNYNSGSHELFLRFEFDLINDDVFISPRFF